MSRKDYRLDVRVRNNNILQAIEALNFTSVTLFCKQHGLAYSQIFSLISMTMSPLTARGTVRTAVVKLMTVLNKRLDELFSEDQLVGLDTNRSTVELNTEEMYAMVQATSQLEHAPEDAVDHAALIKVLDGALGDLSPQYRDVIQKRFGIGCQEMTLSEIGAQYDLSSEAIRRIEALALRKLRHPVRSHKLVPFISNN